MTPTPTGETAVLDAVQMLGRPQVRVDRSRDALLTDFGRATLDDRYLLPGESYQDMFARVACAYADDAAHAQRLYDYMSRLWFMPATPVLSNGGTKRGLPISCFLNEVSDSLDGIVGTWNENVWLASNGGGIGTYWGKVRSIGEKVADRQDLGHHPLHPGDGRPDACDQPGLAAPRLGGGLSRHLPSGDRGVPGDPQALGGFNRKALNLHHGIHHRRIHACGGGRRAVGRSTSPKNGSGVREISARAALACAS